MFYQWLIDTLMHLDECLDKTQEAHEETRTEMSVWLAAAKNFDNDFEARLKQHIDEHHLIDANKKAKRSVWMNQWDGLKEAIKFATSGTMTAIVVVALKWLGVI